MSPTDHSIEALVRAVYELTALQRDIPRMAGFEHPVGLVPLGAVHQCAPARVKDLAEYLHVDLSVASRQVAALEAAGFVRRDPDQDDRRSQRVSTTERGDAALRDAHARIVGVFETALGAWSREDVEGLTAALCRLRVDYEHAAGHPHHSSTTKEAA